MLLLTSYKDDKVSAPNPMSEIGADTKAGMADCARKTRIFASEQDKNPQPQNTRSDPADRIRRFREGIGSTKMSSEDKDIARQSEFYKKSAKFLIQCILAPLYGEKIRVEPLTIEDLNRESDFPGRKFFVGAIIRALDLDNNSIQTLRNRAGRLVGLLSSAGPIPVVEENFDLPELEINENKTLPDIIHNLNTSDKKIMMRWLKSNTDQRSLLCEDIKDILEKRENLTSGDFSDIDELILIESTNYGVSKFPVRKEHDYEVLCDRITVLPIRDKKAPFGYDTKPMYLEMDSLSYVFLPPFSKKTVDSVDSQDSAALPNFTIETVGLVETEENDKKLVSVTIRYELRNKMLKQIARKTYSGEQIRYIKNFPTLTIYGPIPENGWIVRRDLDISEIPSPLTSGSIENTGLKDIVFEGLEFKDTTDNYSLYFGHIPLWVSVKTRTGEMLGALPLRVVSGGGEPDWTSKPNFIHRALLNDRPNPSGTIIVAADIGSSRSAILFHRSSDSDDINNEIFIDNNQLLGIPVIESMDSAADVDFGMMFFQPKNQIGTVEGKIPVGLLTTDAYHNETKESVSLFSSGKLILLDPKSIADASTRKILSDVKVSNDTKQMMLFAQGLLTLIVDRAVHLQCSNIELRLAYLKERYDFFKNAWDAALKKFSERWQNITVRTTMYLPESLAVANELKFDNNALKTTSGAAIVDIGDFTTDIAIFINENGNVILKDNFSIQFAGRQIILQPIWDYLLFFGAKVESLYKQEVVKNNDCKRAIARLEEALTKQKKDKKRKLDDVVRRDLLCLMRYLDNEKVPDSLRNLFDICYLTEIVILKRILRNYPPKHGAFGIHLFGGGRSLIKANGEGYDWNATFGRLCTTNLPQNDGKTLAFGLLRDIHSDLRKAAEKMQQEAVDYEAPEQGQAGTNIDISADEFREAYIRFLQNAQALKKWKVLDRNDSKVSTGKLFNVIKPNKNSDGIIADEALYGQIYDDAAEFAKAGSIKDPEIVKTLFAYKMAYSSAVAFYSKIQK
jgi:hypothetical protein